jgi:pimeloyl-ACP methyl ester carboxylesterase
MNAETVASGMSEATSFTVSGEGAAVVLIHGVGMARSIWEPQIDALRGEFKVIAYDMLGHGGSALPCVDPALADYAVQLADLLDHLDVAAAHVVGHSMGALVALEFALRYPSRVTSVAALNAVYDRTTAQRSAVLERAALMDGSPPDAAAIDSTIARWFDEPVPDHLALAEKKVRELLASVDPAGYARTYKLFASSDQMHVGRLSLLRAPALFMTGECDPNSNPAMSLAMAAAAPRARADILPNERHMMNVTAPDLVSERLRQFILDATSQSSGA